MTTRSFLRLSLLLLGLVCLGLVFYRVANDKVNSLKVKSVRQVKTEERIPVKLIIPNVGIDVAVTPTQIVDTTWQVFAKSANFLTTSASLEDQGNIIIYGHNKKEIFQNLALIKPGDSITLFDQAGEDYQYFVIGTFSVKKDDLSLIQPEPEKVLTLYTCQGLLDSHRFIVRAISISPS